MRTKAMILSISSLLTSRIGMVHLMFLMDSWHVLTKLAVKIAPKLSNLARQDDAILPAELPPEAVPPAGMLFLLRIQHVHTAGQLRNPASTRADGSVLVVEGTSAG